MIKPPRMIKSLLQTRALTVGAVVTFALGIGLNAAVFSAVDRVLFRRLPYDQPDRLYVMNQYRPGSAQADAGLPAAYVVRARRAPGIEEVTLSSWTWYRYRFSKDTEGARTFGFVPMAHTALKTLGVKPIIGTDFTEEDAKLQKRKVLITKDIWQREFHARSDIVGQPIYGSAGTIGEIAGVLPADFIPPQMRPTEAWSGIAVTIQILDESTKTTVFTPPFIRLRPGVSQEQAQAQIDAIVANVGPEFPARNGQPPSVVRLEPLRQVLLGRYTEYGALIFGGACLVLLVACANLSGLLLVRARSQEYSVAIKLALGSTRAAIIRTALFESALLSIAGCLAALALLRLANQILFRFLPPTFVSYAVPIFDPRVVWFSAGLALTSGLVAGVIPGWQASRANVLNALQRGTSRFGPRLPGKAALLAFEIALSTVLVVAAVLMARTLQSIRGSDVGFESKGLVTVTTAFRPGTDLTLQLQQFREMVSSLRRIPGVISAAGADALPIVGAVNRLMSADLPNSQRCLVTDGFVETLGMHVLAGRTIGADDLTTGNPVGVLSVLGLRSIWPNVAPIDAVGRVLQLPGDTSRQIVGVVSDLRYPYLAPAIPTLYVPIGSSGLRNVTFAVRTTVPTTLSAASVGARFKDDGYLVTGVQVNAVDDSLDAAVVNETFRAWLLAGFGIIAALLAGIGIYAVQSFTFLIRRSELSLRVSLGATAWDLRKLLLFNTLVPSMVGIVAGLLVAYGLADVVRAFLYGVDARDPLTFGGVALMLVMLAVAAVWVPARRASRADPAEVLRC